MCARKAEKIVFLTIAKVEGYCSLWLTNSVDMEIAIIGSQLLVYMSKRAAVQMEWFFAPAQKHG